VTSSTTRQATSTPSPSRSPRTTATAARTTARSTPRRASSSARRPTAPSSAPTSSVARPAPRRTTSAARDFGVRTVDDLRNLTPAQRRLALAGAGGAGAAGGYGGHKVGKSFGGQVLEELSKALNDDERDTVISKAMDVVEDIAKRNDELEQVVAGLLDDREHEGFLEVAKGYEVPVEADELASVLHKAAAYMDDDELAVLDRVLTGASEITKSYFEEVGYGGQVQSDILAQVEAIADNAVVSKGAELGLTREQAIASLFENNPAAYDAYEAETR
jgi:hypothetical protein